jgi:hypothetical protein
MPGKKVEAPSWQLSRDMVLFLVGLLGVLHEALFTSLDRPSLLVLFAGMMGLPAFLRSDEKKKRLNNNGGPVK